MKRLFYYMLIGIFSVIFLICGVIVCRNFLIKDKFGSDISDLAELIEVHTDSFVPQSINSIMPQAAIDDFTGLSEITDSSIVDSLELEKVEYIDDTSVLPDYSKLYEMNNDFAGWITIYDTIVSYPVMQTKDEPDYYLHRNFYKNYSRYGLPFISADCDIACLTDSILIYGHNMKDGSVFASILNYEDPNFCERNPIIRFDTMDKGAEYQVLAVFKTTAAEGGFPYYNYLHLEDQESFDDFISSVKALALYCTGVTPVYNTQLLMLSTCEYSVTDGRIVVVAQQIGVVDNNY